MVKKASYTFGERDTERDFKTGKDVKVYKTPKYNEAKARAIEAIESEQYKGVLLESDFWILKNAMKNGGISYTGLIISHNGCLKINDALPAEKRYKPECVTVDTNGYGGSLVFSYCDPAQGVYEVGEVNAKNCSNAYPYAMALKRCIDRVILKNSRLAYAGIYSDSEADEFKEPEPKKEEPDVVADAAKTVILPEGANPRQLLVNYCKENDINIMDVAKAYKLNNDTPAERFLEVLSILINLEEG